MRKGDSGAVRPPLIQYWDAEEIPEYVSAALHTFAERNPELRHLVFCRDTAAEFVAENIGPREAQAFRACAVPAMQADYFRLCAAVALGGIYADADFHCIAPLAPLLPGEGRVRVFQSPRGLIINGIFCCGSPGHAFFELALEIATVNIERRIPDSVYFATGAPILTGIVALGVSGSQDGSIAPIEHPPLEEAARLYWDAIGSAKTVSAALDGVEVRPFDDYRAKVRPGRMPYKQTDAHWANFRGRIFAD